MQRSVRKLIKAVCPIGLALFCAPRSAEGMIASLVAFTVLGVAAKRVEKLADSGRRPLFRAGGMKTAFWLAVILSVLFYGRWEASDRLTALAGLAHLSWDFVRFWICLLAGGCAWLYLDYLIVCLGGAARRFWADAERRLETCRKAELFFKNRDACVRLLLLLSFSTLEYMQLFLSMTGSFEGIFAPGALLVLNIAAMASVNLAFALLLRKWRRAFLAAGIFFTVWSLLNPYVILFHGSPLFPGELVNTATALRVLGGYTFTFLPETLVSIAVAGLEWLMLPCAAEEKGRLPGRRMLGRGALFVACISAVWLYAKDRSILGWSWRESVESYGVSLCAADSMVHMVSLYRCPEGYDIDLLWEAAKGVDNAEGEYPDIIVILNESFCDLDFYSSVSADRDYLYDFYLAENAAYGYAVVPEIGGGTNASEFELLTSKSMYLLQVSAPFNYVDFKQAKSSIVQYVKALGYTAAGMHCKDGANYSRNKAYPALGFDTVLLGDDFLCTDSNGRRSCLDLNNYENLIDYYETAPQKPRFLYLLTYQNHGGYEQNGEELDTVHTGMDFGGLTDDVNEYLSSVALSASAFRRLTEYFSGVDRPVMICMVGDHAPALITELLPNSDAGKKERSIAQRTVPYVIWSNFDADFSACTEYVSMVDLMPLVVSAARLPMSDFYRTILKLHEQVPIRTSDGLYVEADGTIRSYGEESARCSLLQQYYYMEYNSLIGGEVYRADLFLPETGKYVREEDRG